NYGTEQGPRPDYREWVNRLSARVFEKGLDDSETLALLREQGIKYIYIGQRQGKVNNPGPILEPEQLLASAYFEPVYHQDRVWVFALNGR
ncbi:MAG: hypothetical protein ACRDH2_05230, partial [Anaerolineales bacterium]